MLGHCTSMTNGKRNRQAGHKWERQLAAIFRSIGFPHVVTTRSESKSRDNQKVDLINKDEANNGRFPFNVQAKSATVSLKYAKLLSEMPKDRGVMNIVMHKQTRKVNNNFVESGRYVIMYLNDFVELVRQVYEPKLTKKRVARPTKGRVAKAVHDTADTTSDRGV